MNGETTKKEEFRFDGDKIWQKIKDLARKGNIRHLVLKSGKNNTIFSMTVTIAVILVILAPQIMVILALVALLFGCSIVVEIDETHSTGEGGSSCHV